MRGSHICSEEEKKKNLMKRCEPTTHAQERFQEKALVVTFQANIFSN